MRTKKTEIESEKDNDVMGGKLSAIKQRLQEIRSARERKAAELAAAQEKARAEAEKAAKKPVKVETEGMTREEYIKAVADCQEVETAARDDLRAFADTMLMSFHEARQEYIDIIEDVEALLREMDDAVGDDIKNHRHAWNPKYSPFIGQPSAFFFGNPNAPGYRTGKFKLWQAVDGEFPKPVKLPEHTPKRNIYETPTARSYEEIEEFKRQGLRSYGSVIEGTPVQTPEAWLDPSIKWVDSSVVTIEPKLGEVPARMDYEGNIQEGGTFGADGRVYIPPKD